MSINGLQSKHHFEIFDDNPLLMGRASRSMLEEIKVIVPEYVKELNDSQEEMEQNDLAIGDFVLISLAVACSSKKQSSSKLYYVTVLATND